MCKLGGTVDDSTIVPGTLFDHKASKAAGGPTRVENAKIGLIQFCISPPKTDLENNVIISDYTQMDRCAGAPALWGPSPWPRPGQVLMHGPPGAGY